MTKVKPPSAWGTRGAPLLPQSLRTEFAALPVPRSLRLALDVEPLSWADLHSQIWRRITVDEKLAESAVVLATTQMLGDDTLGRSLIPLFNRRWPKAVRPRDLPIRARTVNALKRERIYSKRDVLETLTVGDVLEISGAGVVTLLDFACTVEAAVERVEARLALSSLRDHPAPESLVLPDPRLDAFIEGFEGSLDELLEHDALTDRVHEPANLARAVDDLTRQTLTSAVRGYLKALVPEWDEDRVVGLSMRLGFEDAKKPTLEQTGDLIGLTRERVRQLEKIIKARAAEYPTRPYLPQIDKALHVLRANAPTSCDAAAHDLSAIDSRSLHPAAVLRTAEFFARKPGVEIVAVGSECLVVPKDKLESFERAPVILSEARKQEKRYGASNLQQLRWGLEEKGVVVEETDLEQVLDVAPSAHLDSGWFWFSVKGLQNTLVTTGRKMLSVNSPLSIASMREGLRRRAAFRQRDVVPPKAILRLLFQRSPHFELVGDGADPMVASTEELDPAKELGSVQLTIVRILQKAPNGILDRETLMKALPRGWHQLVFGLRLHHIWSMY